MTGLLDWLHRRSLAPHALARRLEKLRTLEDTRLRLPPPGIRPGCSPVVALEGAYHAAGVAEVYVTLAWIATPPTLLVAFILETANRLTNVVFKFVPMRLGVDEAGSALLDDRPRLHERDGRHAGAGPEGADARSGRRSACSSWPAGAALTTRSTSNAATRTSR